MSRNLRDSLVGGGRNVLAPGSVNHRRRQSFTGFSKETDENLDLFSKNRRSLSIASPDECSDVSLKLGRLSLGSAKLAKSAVDDLLSSTDGGKHDYDWLLTPPGTPIFPSSDGNESQTTKVTSRSRSLVRSTSTTNTSRLSVSHSESNHSARPTRSSSVTRPSISTYSSNKSSSILNTSSASVSSYIRPSSPITRSPSTARPSSPSTRSTSSSRSSTPSRARPVSTTSSSVDKPRSSSRLSTPSSRPQIPANLNSPAARSSSRPSTPTRRNLAPSFSAASGPSTSATYGLANGRSSAPSSRPSSPGPRVQPSQDFPLDTPPNLRTTLPDRPVSAGRSRPSAPLSSRGNPEPPVPVNVPRRQSSPIVTLGRFIESAGRGRVHSKGGDAPEPRKASHNAELVMLKLARTSPNLTDSNGFGRTLSKKSLDMVVKHMERFVTLSSNYSSTPKQDTRNGTCNNRPISGTTLFPQSIRSATQKLQSARTLSSSASSVASNGSDQAGANPENGSYISRACEGRGYARLTDVDIHESSRYDSIFQKEDLKNTNWLHSADDQSDDQVSIFGHGFEHLPEPFGML